MPTRDALPHRASVPTDAARKSDTDRPYRDLCSNCDNASECDGGTRPRRPIFFCEEFMVLGAVSSPRLDHSASERPRAAPGANGHIGLCVNCDNAPICVLPKPEGGVWHCEEYR